MKKVRIWSWQRHRTQSTSLLLNHPGTNWRQFINNIYFPAKSIFGVTLWVVSSIVFLFVLFGVIAQRAGLGKLFIDRKAPDEETSYGNAGVISPWTVVPQFTPGVWKSVPQSLLYPKGPVKVRWRDLPAVLPWAWSFFAQHKT